MSNVVILEADVERARKEVIAIDQRGQRDLAQWLVDHPRWDAVTVAKWLECSASRIKRLRCWAAGGFIGTPHSRVACGKPRPTPGEVALKLKENLENDDFDEENDFEENDDIRGEILDAVDRHKAIVRAFKKVLNVRGYELKDEEREELKTAITELISLWDSVVKKNLRHPTSTKEKENGKDN